MTPFEVFLAIVCFMLLGYVAMVIAGEASR